MLSPGVWLVVLTSMVDKRHFSLELLMLLGYQPDAEVCLHVHIIASVAFNPLKSKQINKQNENKALKPPSSADIAQVFYLDWKGNCAMKIRQHHLQGVSSFLSLC